MHFLLWKPNANGRRHKMPFHLNQVSNSRLAGQMRPAEAFCVAYEGIKNISFTSLVT